MFAKNTSVPVSRTRGEIEMLLEKSKAKQFGTAVDYELGQARVQFKLHDRIIRFLVKLPTKGYGRTAETKYEQAERQRWRALLLVLKAKLESVESHIETFEEAFLAHVVMPNGETVAEIIRPQIAGAYETGKMPRQLTAGDEAAS